MHLSKKLLKRGNQLPNPMLSTGITFGFKEFSLVERKAWKERGWVGCDKSSGVCKEDGKYEGLRQPQRVGKFYKNT